MGESHSNLAAPLNNLAGVYYVQSKYIEAEPLYLRSLTICEKSLGINHPNTKTIRENLKLLQIAKKY